MTGSKKLHSILVFSEMLLAALTTLAKEGTLTPN